MSRPFLVKLLDASAIPSRKVGVQRRVKIEGLQGSFGQIVIPTEKVSEMRGKKRGLIEAVAVGSVWPERFPFCVHVDDGRRLAAAGDCGGHACVGDADYGGAFISEGDVCDGAAANRQNPGLCLAGQYFGNGI